VSRVVSLAFAAQVVRISVPYVLAALGGIYSERSGVINIALEGLLLVGAFAAALASFSTGSALAGIALGVLAGVALAALYGLAVIRWRADQIVCGVAVTLLALGGTRFFLKLAFGSTSNSPRIAALSAPAWAAAGGLRGFLGETLGSPLVVATALAVAAAHLSLFHTRFGLRLRAAGEHPEAAESLGVRVRPLRWRGVLLSGALAGLGGVWLAYDQHGFVAGMSAGRGFIALAAMILGGWTPLGALAACLLFGAAEALQLRLQSSSLPVGSGLVQVMPYAVTIVALTLRARRQVAPRALGRPDGV
jgi:simple sugar transport system permease protein